jgi:NADH pyrophosphatase NudC (nudix superfamily)
MEHGEQPAEALRREVAEETGLSVALGPVNFVYAAPTEVMNIVFRGCVTGGSFSPSNEISEARWFSLDSIPSMMPNQAELIHAWEAENDGPSA